MDKTSLKNPNNKRNYKITKKYKPSRDENGEWLELFSRAQFLAEEAFDKACEEQPDIHPIDIATAMKSILDYKAICRHRINQRSSEDIACCQEKD